MKREHRFKAWHVKEKRFIDLNGVDINFHGCLNEGSIYRVYEQGVLKAYPIEDIELIEFTGLKDKNGKEIYANYIISDGKNNFRVYAMRGGFAIKASFWAAEMGDLSLSDELIIQPLADAQTASYVTQSCENIGNVYQNAELIKQ